MSPPEGLNRTLGRHDGNQVSLRAHAAIGWRSVFLYGTTDATGCHYYVVFRGAVNKRENCGFPCG